MFKTALKWRIIIHFAWRVVDDTRGRHKTTQEDWEEPFAGRKRDWLQHSVDVFEKWDDRRTVCNLWFGVLWGEERALTTGGREKMRSAPLSL
jgi:hypothetical protein